MRVPHCGQERLTSPVPKIVSILDIGASDRLWGNLSGCSGSRSWQAITLPSLSHRVIIRSASGEVITPRKKLFRAVTEVSHPPTNLMIAARKLLPGHRKEL
jgi:hypothetical protein